MNCDSVVFLIPYSEARHFNKLRKTLNLISISYLFAVSGTTKSQNKANDKVRVFVFTFGKDMRYIWQRYNVKTHKEQGVGIDTLLLPLNM